MNDYKITDHLRERFIERSHKKFAHLKECRGCERCVDLVYEINNSIKLNRREIDCKIREMLIEAKEDRSYLNNSEFIGSYYEKYGYDHRIRFMVNGALVFVCIEDPTGRKFIPTCLQSAQHIAVKHKKFKKTAS